VRACACERVRERHAHARTRSGVQVQGGKAEGAAREPGRRPPLSLSLTSKQASSCRSLSASIAAGSLTLFLSLFLCLSLSISLCFDLSFYFCLSFVSKLSLLHSISTFPISVPFLVTYFFICSHSSNTFLYLFLFQANNLPYGCLSFYSSSLFLILTLTPPPTDPFPW